MGSKLFGKDVKYLPRWQTNSFLSASTLCFIYLLILGARYQQPTLIRSYLHS